MFCLEDKTDTSYRAFSAILYMVKHGVNPYFVHCINVAENELIWSGLFLCHPVQTATWQHHNMHESSMEILAVWEHLKHYLIWSVNRAAWNTVETTQQLIQTTCIKTTKRKRPAYVHYMKIPPYPYTSRSPVRRKIPFSALTLLVGW